jgi:cholesterol transport system auxiliary component
MMIDKWPLRRLNPLSLRIAIFILFSLFFSACVGLNKPSPTITQYTLQYDPPAKSQGNTLPVVLKVERFQVAPEFNTFQMVYGESAFERNVYHYHQWRSNPGDLVNYALMRDLRNSGSFSGVLPRESPIRPTHILEGMVDQFYEKDGSNTCHAVLTMGITLMVLGEPDITKRILLQKSYHEVEPCDRRNPAALAKAMSHAMGRISGKIIKDLETSLGPPPIDTQSSP